MNEQEIRELYKKTPPSLLLDYLVQEIMQGQELISGIEQTADRIKNSQEYMHYLEDTYEIAIEKANTIINTSMKRGSLLKEVLIKFFIGVGLFIIIDLALTLDLLFFKAVPTKTIAILRTYDFSLFMIFVLSLSIYVRIKMKKIKK
ncbi:hypothetical protein [Aquimarina algiphila]|uniref:Uncharacterized protein n=1 Tax=Aquimarina algiphila TaxID=2047982 RepID=A0A554VRM9_9FLAO|nr:hypothetical protein [Aquimarina algiphila]TSE11310.1 hypothetical protein FOF46_01385 [Aquimarina algiphila]